MKNYSVIPLLIMLAVPAATVNAATNAMPAATTDPDSPVMLEAPAEIGVGQPIDIRWSGPDDLGATISVNRVDDAEDAHLFYYSALKARRNYERANAGVNVAVAAMQLPAPPVAGDYEIRYTMKLSNAILARRPIRVNDSHYTLDAVDNAPVATPIKIDWSGTLTAGDFVTIVPKDSDGVFDNTRYAELQPGQPAQLITPETPGDYEIRYIMNGGKTKHDDMRFVVQQSIPLNVTDVVARVAGPPRAVGGSTIEVSWQAPDAGWNDDVLTIVPRGSNTFNRDSSATLVAGGQASNPASIRVPVISGKYDIAYVLVPGERIIARAPLSIKRPRVKVSAPKRVRSGQAFNVQYRGDVFDGDRLVVVPADYPDDKMWGVSASQGFAADAARTSGIVAANVITDPGKYELRFVSGLQHQVLARRSVTVTE
ncbi:MAG: hypothetical protein KJO35_10410 [Gammaproteobacteria bacterium]|nr:hypothetical protein [Gammaproteobacteria bacterium]